MATKLNAILALAAIAMVGVGVGFAFGWDIGLAAGGLLLFLDLQLGH